MSIKSMIVAGVLFGTSAFAANAADYTMKISMGPGPQEHSYYHGAVLQFEKDVEEMSDGRIDVEIYWNQVLGKHETVINLVRKGQVEAIITSEGHVTPLYPNLEMLGIPYLFRNREIARDVIDGPFIETFNERMAKEVNIRPLAWMENGGFRHFSSNKPLASIDDLQGQKIRTMTNPAHMEMVKALGASPTPVAWADLYTALQTGVVDGEENSLSTFRIPKLEEVQKYILLDGHVFGLIVLWVSEDFYSGLPDDLKAVLDEAAAKMVTLQREMVVKAEVDDRKYLEDYGVTIVDVPDAEKARFKEVTFEPVLTVVREKVDPALLDQLLEAVADAEKRHPAQ